MINMNVFKFTEKKEFKVKTVEFTKYDTLKGRFQYYLINEYNEVKGLSTINNEWIKVSVSRLKDKIIKSKQNFRC